MKNHGTSHVADCLNGSFGDTILMMCVGAAEPQFLVRFIDMRNECVGLESSTVGEVVLNNNAIVHTYSFESLLGPNGFAGRKSSLVLNMHVRGGMVHEYASSFEGGGGWLSERFISSSMKSVLEVINRDS
jgi:hypothetical protein